MSEYDKLLADALLPFLATLLPEAHNEALDRPWKVVEECRVAWSKGGVTIVLARGSILLLSQLKDLARWFETDDVRLRAGSDSDFLDDGSTRIYVHGSALRRLREHFESESRRRAAYLGE